MSRQEQTTAGARTLVVCSWELLEHCSPCFTALPLSSMEVFRMLAPTTQKTDSPTVTTTTMSCVSTGKDQVSGLISAEGRVK